jgi:hypothetical protein
MPVHDWTRVDAGTFHDFHTAWVIHLKETLNGGLLPAGYYALAEQHAGRVIADVLTLEEGHQPERPRETGPVAVAEAPPRVRRKVVAGPGATYRAARRTLTVRHVSGHRIVALIEILSPANKDRSASVRDFVDKVHAALRHGCHLLVVDLFPPSPYDRAGIHGAIWEDFGPDEEPPPDKPLTLAAYAALQLPEAYVEPIAVGDVLPDMPLFLQPDGYVNVPLEVTYQAAYQGMPGYWRSLLEAQRPPVRH